MNIHPHNTWSLKLLAVLIAGSCFMIAFNYLVDPFGVFQTHFFPLRSGYTLDDRYRKVEHLIHDPFPGLIVGSSLMGVYDPSIAHQATSMPFYNMSFLDGRPHEYIQAIKALKKNGYPIKEVLIGIDFYVFSEPPDEDTPSHREHPLVSGESKASFFSYFLVTNGLYQGTLKIIETARKYPSSLLDVDHDGRFFLFQYDREIKDDHKKYIQQMLSHKLPPSDIKWRNERFDEFADFCSWLRENGIQSKVFIHPFYINFRNSVSSKSFNEFREKILRIRPDTVDFADSKIIYDPEFYYDPHHYRPMVAKKIMQIMFSSTPVAKDLDSLESKIHS